MTTKTEVMCHSNGSLIKTQAISAKQRPNFTALCVREIFSSVVINKIRDIMVAYFCHHLSDNYVDLSDLYVDLSVIYVDLSEKYHHNY